MSHRVGKQSEKRSRKKEVKFEIKTEKNTLLIGMVDVSPARISRSLLRIQDHWEHGKRTWVKEPASKEEAN